MQASLEIEPPILFPAGIPDNPAPADAAGSIVQLEKDLVRAEKNAASAERLCKSGIISRVEVEQRGLRVMRLHAELAAARLEQLRGQLSESDGHTDRAELIEAERLAKAAADARREAEMEIALRNVQRQQKLLALGSARKSDVSRAEEKVAELRRTRGD